MIFAEHVKIDLDFNMFKRDSAFSYNDNLVPTGGKNMIFHFAGRIAYSF